MGIRFIISHRFKRSYGWSRWHYHSWKRSLNAHDPRLAVFVGLAVDSITVRMAANCEERIERREG